MKKIILTGDRPTGRLHVGHYVGSLKERVRLQNSGEYDEIYVMIADAQALTDNADNPEKVRQNILQVALDYLACGIDPAKTHIFIQSMVPELTELSFYYMNLVTVSRLQRNPTVKSEIHMRNFETSIPVGFFCYPISQAADITAFHATTVPAGEDQKPMIEQCCEIVRKFNAVYGDTLTEPEIVLPQNAACLRLPGTDGKAKMSKSLGNCIYLSEEPEDIKKKVMSMYTDPNHLRVQDPGKVEGNPVFIYLDAFCRPEHFAEFWPEYQNLDELKAHYQRGGLGEVNIVASMIFGGISGSSVADTSALGSILIPAMEKEGYPPEASAGITVASSTMGMIIPPSTPMIVYSMISGASVGALFVAGAVPGILIGLTQLVLVYIISAKKGWHPEKVKFDGKRAAKSLLSGIPALIMPLFIIICVSFGVCTASESAGVAVLYSMLVGFFVYKELTWKGVWEALKKTLISSSSIMLIIGFTTIFTWVLTMQKVPQTVGAFFMSLNMPAWAIALIFDVLILMIGTFIDVSPAILLLTPILLPVMVQYGFSPLQFGAMMITGLAIGLVTPPVGMCLNACNKINRMPIIEIFKGAAPYVICNVIVLISISLWGPLTTALPQLLGYSIF